MLNFWLLNTTILILACSKCICLYYLVTIQPGYLVNVKRFKELTVHIMAVCYIYVHYFVIFYQTFSSISQRYFPFRILQDNLFFNKLSKQSLQLVTSYYFNAVSLQIIPYCQPSILDLSFLSHIKWQKN